MSESTTLLLTAIGAAIGALVLILGLYAWINRRRLSAERTLRARLGDLSAVNPATSIAILRGDESPRGLLDKLLAGRPFAAVVAEEMRRGGIGWSVGRFVAYVMAGIAAGVVAALWFDTVVATAIGVLGALTPFFLLARARRRRERRIEEQLPDAVDMLVNALRAGYSLQAGMSFVGTEMSAPVGPEFARFYDEQRLGMDVRQALENLQDRMGTLDARMFVLALIIQRDTGGNLSEILGNIAQVIRQRIEFRGQVDVLTSEAKLSAIVLGALPVVLFFAVRIVNPEYSSSLIDTQAGQWMIWYGVGSLLVGFVLMRQMAHIEV